MWKFLLISLILPHAALADSWMRIKLTEPATGTVSYQLRGYIHNPPWYLPKGRLPEAKDKTVASGEWSSWFNVSTWAGKALHGRMQRAGGLAEFPNLTLTIHTSEEHPRRSIEVQLATKNNPDAVVRTLKETLTGNRTSFLISPNLKQDADELETASEMTARRLSWAKEATGGKRQSPKNHILQTSLWAAQRDELQRKELEVLSLLGFNVVGNKKLNDEFPELRVPGHSHRIALGPSATREQISSGLTTELKKRKHPLPPGVPYGFKDEICARPAIGENVAARAHFHQWLAQKEITPKSLGVENLGQVIPLETPDALNAAMKENESAARRVFYYTSIFRQKAGTERLKWNTETFHKHATGGALTSTLVADHPYFAGTGLGMGMIPNTAWGGAPLALDWFDLARNRAVDLIGIEDWMGLQYMYGPNYTWEGFQLMGFQSAIMRSGAISGGAPLPIIAWITPSDETNFRLKSASALCQGAKHFFFWTYGPTATSTENYWSDLRGAYDGMAHLSKQLAFSEPLIHEGQLRPTKIAILYSISSDLWQPFDYLHMLERRGAYLAFVHAQHRVDFLTEDDIDAGLLDKYDVLWTSDPCIRTSSVERIKRWTAKPTTRLIGSCGAGFFNEFGEPTDALASTFGYKANLKRDWKVQKGRYRYRAGLNSIPAANKDDAGFSWIGLTGEIMNDTGKIVHTFARDLPAEIQSTNTRYFCGTPTVSYIKDAKFVAKELKEEWPTEWRDRMLQDLDSHPAPVTLSHPVVEAGLYDSPNGSALVLANFTYQKIESLEVSCEIPFQVGKITSAEQGKRAFKQEGNRISFQTPLGLSDIIRIE